MQEILQLPAGDGFSLQLDARLRVVLQVNQWICTLIIYSSSCTYMSRCCQQSAIFWCKGMIIVLLQLLVWLSSCGQYELSVEWRNCPEAAFFVEEICYSLRTVLRKYIYQNPVRNDTVILIRRRNVYRGDLGSGQRLFQQNQQSLKSSMNLLQFHSIQNRFKTLQF